MRWFALVLLLSGPALAAGPAGDGAPQEHRWSSPAGYSVVVPRGLAMDVLPAPEGATPDQALESLTLRRDGSALVTIDVFDDFDDIGVDAWLAREMAFLRTPEATVRSFRHRGAPAVRIEQPRSPQSYARTIVLLRAGRLLVRVTCEDASDPTAAAALERVVGSLTEAP